MNNGVIQDFEVALEKSYQWLKGRPNEEFDRTTANRDSRVARIKKGLSDLDSVLASDPIYAVRYGEAMYLVKNGYEEFVQLFIYDAEMMRLVREDRTSDALQDFYYANRSLNQSHNFLKKLRRLMGSPIVSSAVNLHEHLKKLEDFIEIGVKLKEVTESVKSKLVKGRVPNPNSAAALRFQPKFTPASFKMLKDLVDKEIESVRTQHENAVAKLYIETAEEIIKDHASMEYREFRKNLNKSDTKIMIYPRLLSGEAQMYGEMKVRPDWKTVLISLAKRDVANIYEQFSSKNARKLAAIFDNKSEVSYEIKTQYVRLRGISLEAFMNVTFTDGAKFSVSNSIEWAISSRGKGFIRFPTRFTDVFLSDGNRMSSPSEEKMNKEFK